MPYTLTESVQREIERTFAPEDLDYVRSRLSAQELHMERSAPPPRVHIAVIWLSKVVASVSTASWRGLVVIGETHLFRLGSPTRIGKPYSRRRALIVMIGSLKDQRPDSPLDSSTPCKFKEPVSSARQKSVFCFS